MNNWEIYDSLIDGIDPFVKVKSITLGNTWTEVISDAGGTGLGMTTHEDAVPERMVLREGMYLKEAAALLKSWNFLEASVGMAAVNAFYNTEERLEKYGWEQPDERFCTFDVETKGKRLGMIGHLRHDEGLFSDAAELSIIEMHRKDGDYPAPACEFIIPGCDVVIITGSAFINKTMPRLLELSKDAFTVVTGPSSPMAECLVTDHNIQRVAGFIPVEKYKLHQFVKEGRHGPPYRYGRRFFIDKHKPI